MKFEHMFSPIQIGHMVVKNRFVVPPMGNNFANTDGTWSEQSVAYYAERAKGQFGLITIEATVVHEGAKGGPRKPCLYNVNSIESLKKICDAVHAEGGKVSIQLQNAGPEGNAKNAGAPIQAASPIQACEAKDIPKEVPTERVYELVTPLWATVRVTGNAFYLNCDVWGTLWPVNTDIGWYDAVDGQRVITVFNPLWDNYAGYDHAVKLLRLQNVLTKEVETLTPETEEEFGNDPVRIYKGDITISGGYMNIFFMQNLPSSTDNKHRISLVRPQEDDALYGEDGYVHLELRYNDYDDLTGRRSPGAVSYNLNSLDIPSETKGIKLKLNSEENGEVEVTFDLKTAGSNEKLTTNVDLSNMQLK